MTDDSDFVMDLSGRFPPGCSTGPGVLLQFPIGKEGLEPDGQRGNETIHTAVILPFKPKAPSSEPVALDLFEHVSTETLLTENKAWIQRLNDSLISLKALYKPYDRPYEGIERLIELNNLLSQHMCHQHIMEVVQLQNWHYQKNLIAFQYDVPVTYTKLDNTAWILQSINKTLATFYVASERQSLRHYLQHMFDDRLEDMQQMKKNVISEFDQQEQTLLIQVHASHLMRSLESP
jgi:hypothetical protein